MRKNQKRTGKSNTLGALFLSLLLLFASMSQAQTRTVTGTVTDPKTSEPVSGASVIVKGSKKGATTDANGKFSIQVSGNPTLQISAVGFATQEVSAGAGGALSVGLVSTNQQLNEVVVIGYGTQRKATLSGAVTTVDAKAFQNKGPIDNPLQALQGQVPGVVITRSSSAPGREGWNMQIRGATSINGSDPLVLVDGIPLVSLNALNSINPNDIENISFLKDASTAIYGARGAGGVVLVTTKTAKSGKPVIQYDGSVSRKVLGLQPKLLNVQQFGQGLIDATTNDYYDVPPVSYIWYKMGFLMKNAPDSGWLDMNYTYTIDPTTGKITYVGTPVAPSSNPINPGFGDVKDLTFFNTNYADVLWGNSTSTQHNISLSGRGERAGYRLSLGYMGDGSLLQWGQNSNKRYNLRLTNDFQPIDRLKIETNIALEKNDIIQPANTGYLSQYQQPGFPIQTKNGQPYAWGTQYSANWLADLGGENKEYNTRIFSTLRSTLSLTKNLRFIGQASYNWNITDIKLENKSISWWNYAGTIRPRIIQPNRILPTNAN